MAVLVVEVADASLDFDRERKRRIYAAAGIPEYWLVNLPERRIEVYREPASSTAGSNADYRQHAHYGSQESLSLLRIPGASIAVSDLLP
jgi:Uma2 family endonuclease